MSYAIIEESGGQRKVTEGEEIWVDLLDAGTREPDSEVVFDRVLVIGGDETKLGRPYLDGASVKGQVIEPIVKGEKLYIQKFRPKKASRSKTGHRQRYTSVKITSITG